jgi:hypothetical protein
MADARHVINGVYQRCTVRSQLFLGIGRNTFFPRDAGSGGSRYDMELHGWRWDCLGCFVHESQLVGSNTAGIYLDLGLLEGMGLKV